MTDNPLVSTPRFEHRNLPQLLLKAREALLAHFRPILTHFGLTEQQWRILRTLSEQGKMEPRHICEACRILSPSLAGMLLRMEESDLIVRQRMPEDQRRVLVSLSARSERLVQDIAPLINEQYRRLETVVGTPLLEEAYELIDQLLASKFDDVGAVQLPFERKMPGRS